MESVVNELFTARRTRLLAASQHLPDAVWEVLVFGLLLVAVYVYLFGPHSYRMYIAVTTLTMLSIGMVFTLVIALDYPFRGDVSVDSEAYTGVQEVAGAVFLPRRHRLLVEGIRASTLRKSKWSRHRSHPLPGRDREMGGAES